eukprot:jgi/Psemu1/45832/gm1.45832_g
MLEMLRFDSPNGKHGVSHQDTVYSAKSQHRRVYSANPQHRTSKRPRIASQIVASRFPPSNVSLTGDSNVSAPPSVRESRYRGLQRLSYRRLQRLSAPPSVRESRYRRLPRLSYRRLPRLSAPPSVRESRYRRLQPQAQHADYTEYYQSTPSPLGVGPARDLAYQTIYDYFAEETATPVLLGRLLDLFEPEAVGALGIFLTDTFGKARLRLVHGLRKYPGPLTAPSTNKGKAFGYLDDIEGDAGELVLVDAALLEQAPETLVLSLDRHLDVRPASSPSNWCPYS